MKHIKKLTTFLATTLSVLLCILVLLFSAFMYYNENEYYQIFAEALQMNSNKDKAETAFILGLYLQEDKIKTIINPDRWGEIDDWLKFAPKTKCVAIFGDESWSGTRKLKLLANNQIGYEKSLSTVTRFECQALSLSKQTLVIQVTGLTFYKEGNEWEIHGWESIEHFLITDNSAICYCPEP